MFITKLSLGHWNVFHVAGHSTGAGQNRLVLGLEGPDVKYWEVQSHLLESKHTGRVQGSGVVAAINGGILSRSQKTNNRRLV
jgi:hypothetical protein